MVADIKKAEETRLRKRRERGRGDDEGDVTYINDKVGIFGIFDFWVYILTRGVEQGIQ